MSLFQQNAKHADQLILVSRTELGYDGGVRIDGLFRLLRGRQVRV
jgi:hypothetical protein|tara:strand:- start:73 stop:207 length:135 start_codon:yes stop_codon:yes gene_type:complete